MSSIMRWRKGLTGVSVMESSCREVRLEEPHNLQTGHARPSRYFTPSGICPSHLPRERFSPMAKPGRIHATRKRSAIGKTRHSQLAPRKAEVDPNQTL